MISIWSVILNGVVIGILFGVINILITMIYDKKNEKAFEEHMRKINK